MNIKRLGLNVLLMVLLCFVNSAAADWISFGGRIQADYLSVDEDSFAHRDGEEIRRARLYAKGKLGSNWKYKAQYDFAGGGEWKDLHITYVGMENSVIQLGQIFEMVSLEGFTSSKHLMFIERSLPVAFVPDRALGVSYTRWSDHWMFATGYYDRNLRDSDVNSHGASARLAWSTEQNGHLWHLGGSLAWRTTDGGIYRSRTRPESHVTDTRLVNTGHIDGVGDYSTMGLELAWLNGPWSIQTEYMQQNPNRSQASDLSFNSWYVMGSFFFTGESRNYDQNYGIFGSVKPLRKSGAWELGLRYSGIDLNDQEIVGGTMDNWTLGLNWYINSNWKMALNYIDSKAEKGQIKDRPKFTQLRLQYVF
ncbi:OprO/OprP family phosphate-selective porin [Marinicella rhabdoformis]|uniref:OprO/OprP family phosphate-selective porin n=1 Tax=Marinicella rhabdoformis TaxID=2580566 RepID=UPI0012AED8DE|nr:porin [Marinicella rhabdoformis]